MLCRKRYSFAWAFVYAHWIQDILDDFLFGMVTCNRTRCSNLLGCPTLLITMAAVTLGAGYRWCSPLQGLITGNWPGVAARKCCTSFIATAWTYSESQRVTTAWCSCCVAFLPSWSTKASANHNAKVCHQSRLTIIIVPCRLTVDLDKYQLICLYVVNPRIKIWIYLVMIAGSTSKSLSNKIWRFSK